MSQTSHVRQTEPRMAVVPRRERPSSAHVEPIRVIPLVRRADKWAMALMAVGIALFSAAMVRFVVFPAMQTLTGAPAEPWSAGF